MIGIKLIDANWWGSMTNRSKWMRNDDWLRLVTIDQRLIKGQLDESWITKDQWKISHKLIRDW